MRRLFYYSIVALTCLCVQELNAQDKANGFASVSGKTLETTTGGEGGQTVIAENLSDLIRYANSNVPYIIIVKGTIEPTSWREIDVGSNTTIVGYGTDATLKNLELHIIDKQNIIIRNLTVRDSYVEGDWDGKENDNDGIQADNCHHLWIDHCHFTHLGDGLIDLRKACDYVTVSYTKLSNHNKAFGIGWTEETDFHMTIHHCWTDNTNQRNPSFDMGIGHLYNNYLSNIASYGNQSRGKARVIVQNSSFYKAKDPISISGTDATLYASNNIFNACTGSQTGNLSSMPFDPADSYTYTLDPVEQVEGIVTAEAGPQQEVSDQYMVTSSNEKLVSNNGKTITYFVNQGNKTLTIKSETAQNAKVKIFSYDGRIVRSMALNSSNEQFSLDELKQGVYILQFEMPNKIETGKIILN